MLACITAVTFASCKWDGEIKEPKIKGDLMTEAEVDAWVEDYEAKAEDFIPCDVKIYHSKEYPSNVEFRILK